MASGLLFLATYQQKRGRPDLAEKYLMEVIEGQGPHLEEAKAMLRALVSATNASANRTRSTTSNSNGARPANRVQIS